jgi:hypothetical protein
MKRDIDGGPVQNPRGVREQQCVCLHGNRCDGNHPAPGRVIAIDGEGRYALVEWANHRRSHHTLRELAPA